MYIVTSRPISEIFDYPEDTGYFAFRSDAEKYAQKQAAETNETQIVFMLTEESKFLPPETSTWELTFSRSMTQKTKVRARNLEEAIKKARDFFPLDEWSLVCSHQFAKEELP